MTYKWKLPGLVPVDAQIAGEELERIYQKYGGITPKTVVDENEQEDAPLHGCFEWDNDIAAGLYRETQAKQIIRSIKVVSEHIPSDSNVRAFVSIQNSYEPISVVIKSPQKTQILLDTAIKELKAFKDKYQSLKELKSILAEIEKLSAY